MLKFVLSVFAVLFSLTAVSAQDLQPTCKNVPVRIFQTRNYRSMYNERSQII